MFFIHPRTYLVDPSVTDLEPWEAVAIAIGGLVVAWVVYDELCRLLGERELALALAVFAFVCLSAWAAGELLSPRARRTSRSARCSGRSWSRTSSS